ncbi:hypothetical protein NDK43_26845 [Neobacillus pocheonensis]|uniref:Uncharacterized protein n=1 Tax=Neobacillus pocheonensis TaxID=363869 RepID=A0ABT0WID4_9BACI|nr:hypothetical protein [Neobacillus pocheonensis]
MEVSELFKGQTLDAECPECKNKILFDARLAFKNYSVITCNICSKQIDLDTTAAKKSAEKAVNELKNLFK